MKALLLILSSVLSNTIVLAQSTYTFTGSGNWRDTANWANRIVPSIVLQGGSIVINPAGSGQCILSDTQTVYSHGQLRVMANKKFVVTGQLKFITDTTSCGTVTDIDGNVYRTRKFGNQCWMVDNLRTTRYRDGSPIPHKTTSWVSLTEAAYCNYNNNATNAAIYGRLYNFAAVTNSSGLCPTGWHVATAGEWATLGNFLGGASVAGGKMKDTGTVRWASPNTGATNSSGFTALPGGYRDYQGAFGALGTSAIFWTSSVYSQYSAIQYDVIHNSAYLENYINYRESGMSCRCVKD
jgi:uncharacterized protein (TIGR02145 family)